MHKAGAVKVRTVLGLWAVTQKEYTSVDKWTHITTSLCFHLSITTSISHLIQHKDSDKCLHDVCLNTHLRSFFTKKTKKETQ